MSNLFTEDALHKKTPQEITSLLYEACIDHLEEAINEINEKNFVIANRKIQKANDILWRLGGGINYEAGIISDQLDALYNYMADKLIEANLNKDITKIEEVLNILKEISQAWNQAMKKNIDVKPQVNRQKAMAYEKSVRVEDY